MNTLEKAGVSSANIHYEILELGRNTTPEYQDSLSKWLQEKYRGLKMDVIITVDGPAQDFILNRGRMLFPGTPIISVLAPVTLNDPVPGRSIIQIPAKVNFEGTLETALQLFPETKTVYFVIGDAPVEKQWLAIAKTAFTPWHGKLRFDYSASSTYEEMLQKAGSLSPDSIIFYLSFYRDPTNRTFVPLDVARETTRIAKVPVFGVYDTLLGVGVLGGSMFSYEYEGHHSAELALDIMSGKLKPAEQLTVIPCLARPMFDYQQVERWHLDMDAFPEGSVFTNRSPTLWGQYKEAVIGALGVLLVLSTLVAALWRMNRRRKLAETDALLSEARFRALVEQAPEAIIVTDVDSNLTVDANKNAFKLFGCETLEQISNRVDLYFLPEQPDHLPLSVSMNDHRTRALAGEEVIFERAIRSAQGIVRICEVRLVLLPSAERRLLRASWIDVTERKHAEAAMASSLREKEILLREIHHRVKNNLQIISSLLSLQGQGTNDPAALSILNDSQGRVMSMALIHQQLYESSDYRGIDAGKYLHKLLSRLVTALKGARTIDLKIEMPAIHMSLDQAIPFGLIMNELVTNSLKHAFRDKSSGMIGISAIEQEDSVVFLIQDDGAGLPPGFTVATAASLGLQIVTMLTDQLHGSLELESQGGTRVRLQLPKKADHA
ncbi:MAG: PAS domain S-box protein [Desulfovibrio sp.]|nr:PAS domain S-box protein [Desulfovibrio sp.]MBI4961008.1 PAS domain S-box protein [Desulfovibrio sp.]